jgi:hypothetical protein
METYNRTKKGKLNISSDQVDESVLLKNHYVLADFTTLSGQAYAINIDNNFAYPIVGKRFDLELKKRRPNLSESRCMSLQPLTINQLTK